jgi:hypothetical protein
MESQPWDYNGIKRPKSRKTPVLQQYSPEYGRQGSAMRINFDPLGLVSPTVISHKTFPQKLWHDNSLWDEQQHPHCGGTVKMDYAGSSNLNRHLRETNDCFTQDHNCSKHHFTKLIVSSGHKRLLLLVFLTKAVHIEVETSLSTEAFICALRRFIARRGRRRTIYSDNGTNFQGAANQLQEVNNMLQCPTQMTRIHDFLTCEGCQWKFIPPHAPHFGGLWEAAVKSMKYHLRRTLGASIATYEELSTLLTEVEACLNSRPLCALSNDPHSSFLSPGHFLIGQPLTQLPSIDYTPLKISRLSRWQLMQQQLQNVWKRWSADYLHELQTRRRWHRSVPNVQIHDVVILREDNTVPCHWPTAVITDVHPGADGKIRVVTFKPLKRLSNAR